MHNQPTHDVFHLQPVGDGKSKWQIIGATWAHRDGKGFSVRLDGRLHLRERREPSEEAEPPTEYVADGDASF